MSQDFDARLVELGIDLPDAPTPAANYVPYVVSGNQVFVAGQIPLLNGKIAFVGKVGDGLDVSDGYEAAKLCGLNLLAQAKAAAGGSLNNIARVVKLGGFVNSTSTFTDQPEVINGASDLMVDVFGDAGRHARFALSAGSLPRGVAVEIDGIFELT